MCMWYHKYKTEQTCLCGIPFLRWVIFSLNIRNMHTKDTNNNVLSIFIHLIETQSGGLLGGGAGQWKSVYNVDIVALTLSFYALPWITFNHFLCDVKRTQNRKFTRKIKLFIWNGCGMPAGNAYPSGHLIPSPFLGLACTPIVQTQIPLTCHVFTRLFTSNTPWFLLDFALLHMSHLNICSIRHSNIQKSAFHFAFIFENNHLASSVLVLNLLVMLLKIF